MKTRKLGELEGDLSVVQLPVGISYPPKPGQDPEFCDQVSIDVIRGTDEENMQEKNVLRNPSLVMTKLLQRIILDASPVWLGKRYDMAPLKFIKSLTQPDRDMISLQAQLLSYGEFADIPWDCPKEKCSEDGIFERFDLRDIEIRYIEQGEEAVISFSLIDGVENPENELQFDGELKMATGSVQELVFKNHKNNRAKAVTAMLSACITHIGSITNTPTTMIARMSSLDRGEISKAIAEHTPGPVLKIPHECPECGHEWEVGISPVNFSRATSPQ